MPKVIIALLVLLFSVFSFASTNHHDNYFQQHLNYVIDAKLDVDLKRIDANQELIYFNFSPDSLKEIYFHLYLNLGLQK